MKQEPVAAACANDRRAFSRGAMKNGPKGPFLPCAGGEGDSPTRARVADSLARESLRIPRPGRTIGLRLSGNENARWRGHFESWRREGDSNPR